MNQPNFFGEPHLYDMILSNTNLSNYLYKFNKNACLFDKKSRLQTVYPKFPWTDLRIKYYFYLGMTYCFELTVYSFDF